MISYQPIFAYVKIQTIMTHLRIFLLKPLSVQELLFIYFYFLGGGCIGSSLLHVGLL